MRKSRTDRQNRYYWGTVVRRIACSSGQDVRTVHEQLKQLFLPCSATSTCDLTTAQFNQYVANAREWAHVRGISTPLPGEDCFWEVANEAKR